MRLSPGLLLVAVLALSGCGTEPAPTAPPTSSTPTVVPTTTASPTPTPTPTVKSGWVECPKIVERLDATAPEGTRYYEVEPKKFAVQLVGAAVLAQACVVTADVGGELSTWAILPGDSELADSVARDLLGGGFTAKGGGAYTNTDTGYGVLVRFAGSGTSLDTTLDLVDVFAPYNQPLVSLSTFGLS